MSKENPNDPKANQQPQPPAGDPLRANSTKMVVVGCKLPNGLLCELGARDDENYHAVRLNGSNDQRVIGGYGITPNVPEDFWNAWVKKHARLEFVRKGQVFVEGDLASAQDHAEERAEVKTGMEPLDPLKQDVKDPETGLPLFEVDRAHLTQGRKDMAKLGHIRR